MPFVLMINAALTNPVFKQHWSRPGWLPEEIGILVEGGQVFCFEGEELRTQLQTRHQLTVYDLVGFVAEIDSIEHQKPHLVSLLNGKSSCIVMLQPLIWYSVRLRHRADRGKSLVPVQ